MVRVMVRVGLGSRLGLGLKLDRVLFKLKFVGVWLK